MVIAAMNEKQNRARSPRTAAIAAALCTLTASLTAHAGGFYAGVKGARAAGRGGAFTARADDLSAVALNPAGIVKLRSTTLHAGNRFSHNTHTFTRAPTLDWGNSVNGVPPYVEFDGVENATPFQPLDPILGVSTTLGLSDWAFAVVAYAPPGVARQEFPADGGQRYMMISRNAIMVHYDLTAAWRASDSFGIGLSLQTVAVPELEYSLALDGNAGSGVATNPVSSPFDMQATISGSDYFTPQAILGAWYKPAPFLEFGLSGQVIPTQIEAQSKLEIEPLGESLRQRAEALGTEIGWFRNDLPSDNDVTLTLPLPITARAGVRYIGLSGARESFDVEFDVQYESWSRVESFTLNSNGLSADLWGTRVPVDVIEVQKQWQDTISLHLGSDVVLAQDLLTLRGGAYWEAPVADPAYANVDFTSGEQLGGALGASIELGDMEIALVYDYRHQLPVEVTEAAGKVTQEVPGSLCPAPYDDPNLCAEPYLGQRSPTVNAGIYRAHTHAGSIDVLYRF